MVSVPYLLRRLLQALLVLWGAWTASFILLQALPGDAVLIKALTTDNSFTLEQLEDLRVVYGSDGSLLRRYVHSTTTFFSGDLGVSIQQDVPVTTLLRVSLPHTMRLSGLAFLLALLLALALTAAASTAGFRWLRQALLGVPALLVSVPSFWLAIVLIQVFSFQLGWVPIINPRPSQALILPILTIALPVSAPIAQVLLRSIDEVRSRGFVAVARAKGLGRLAVLSRHVAQNAVLPALTIAGLVFGELLGGTLVTETIFGLNGIGRLVQNAVTTQDVAVLQALVVISAVVFVLINLLVDLLYPVLDPRLRAAAVAHGG